MFKFVIFILSIAYAAAGIIPLEDHQLHHNGLTFPSSHSTILEHSHFGPIVKVASHHHGSIYSHPHYAVASAPAVVKVANPTYVKVASPIIKYVAQPIVKVAPEPSVIVKSHIPHAISHIHAHELQGHLPKLTYKVATPLVSDHHHAHTLALPEPIHASSVILSAAPSIHHHAALASLHEHHLH